MYVNNLWIRFIAVAGAAAFLASMAARADTTDTSTRDPTPSVPVRPVGPSVNNDAFKTLRHQCETAVQCGKASGDICVDAAALLLGTDLPDEFREVKEDQRVKIALRLLERGVDSSNIARGRAYDWYNRIGFLGVSAYADSYRAKELMEMMDKSGYPGGVLRRIRSATTLLSFGSSEAEKREACATAKKLLSGTKLDADSMKIAKDVVDSGLCTGYEQNKL